MPVPGIKKIVVIGPESTGKSTLCQQLAEYYHTEWCPEYAREYLLKHGMSYSYDDLLTIARGQVELEESFESRVGSQESGPDSYRDRSQLTTHYSPLTTRHSPLLFVDTDMYVMKVWCEFVFGKCHPFVLEQIAKRKYDLYLLCNVDLPWVKDELREYPDLETREKLYHIYKNLMTNQAIPWVDISGNYEERLKTAVAGVNRLIQK